MSVVSVGSTPDEIPGSEATCCAHDLAQSVLTLGHLLADTYTGRSTSPVPSVDLHFLISHVELALLGLSAPSSIEAVSAQDEGGVAAELRALLARLAALAN